MTDDTRPYVRPDVRGLLDMLAAMPGPKLHELEPAAARAQYVMMREVADLPVGELGKTRDLTIPGPAGAIPARLFDARASREPGPAMVFYHGGGFTIGNIDSHASFCAEVARVLDIPVVSVDYRLAPEAKWPAGLDDGEAAARWVATSPAALGRNVTGLVLCGDSAGGTLAIQTAIALRDDPAQVPVLVQAPIYPAADAATDYPSFDAFAEGYLLTRDSMTYFNDHYGADTTHPRGSPMNADLAGLPPAIVLTASLDPLRDQGRAYVGALAKAGVPVTFQEAVGNVHGFITLRKAIPSAPGDVLAFLAALKPMIVAAEAGRVMAQAAG